MTSDFHGCVGVDGIRRDGGKRSMKVFSSSVSFIIIIIYQEKEKHFNFAFIAVFFSNSPSTPRRGVSTCFGTSWKFHQDDSSNSLISNE